MPDEHQTSEPDSDAANPGQAPDGSPSPGPHKPPILPDPAAYQVLLQCLAKHGSET